MIILSAGSCRLGGAVPRKTLGLGTLFDHLIGGMDKEIR